MHSCDLNRLLWLSLLRREVSNGFSAGRAAAEKALQCVMSGNERHEKSRDGFNRTYDF